MSKNKLVGIMVPRRAMRKRILSLYQKYNDLNITLCSFVPEDIDWKENKVSALFYIKKNWKIRKVALPRAIYNRCYKNRRDIVNRIESVIGENRCFNHKNMLNKWDVYNILNKTELKLHLPRTHLFNADNLQQLMLDNDLLFLKPCYGNQGRGVYRIEKLKEGYINVSQDSLPPRFIFKNDDKIKECLENLMKKRKYIIQQGIPFIEANNRYFDIRVLVQKNMEGLLEVSNIVCRISYENYYNTSIVESVSLAETIIQAIFPDAEVGKILDELSCLSIKTAEELENAIKSIAEVSVDFGMDNTGKPWVIEVNGFPLKKIYKEVPNLNDIELIYKRPLQYACFLITSDYVK